MVEAMRSQGRGTIHGETRNDIPSTNTKGLVCAVTVTYGNRRHLLLPVLTTLLEEEKVGKIVVVSNGAEWNVRALANELAPGGVDVFEIDKNRGSAAGFATGIRRAFDLGAEFIWLLDDDNQPEKGSLSELLSAYARLRSHYPEDGLAVAAFRPVRRPDLAAGVAVEFLSKQRPSSFWRFHILDVPARLWLRVRRDRLRQRKRLPPTIEVNATPYGGTLFHRSVVERHGLPREDFVLYGDDVEFSCRITRNGGGIHLVTSARVVDLEGPWTGKRRSALPFRDWLEAEDEVRAFYSARNGTYLDSHCRPHTAAVLELNRRIYCFALWLNALTLRRLDRYRLLQEAIHDGLAGCLGVHPRYRL